MSQETLPLQNTPHIAPTPRMSSSPIPKPTTTARRKPDKNSWDYVLRSGIAGGTAGCAGKTLIAPLDRVKILFQASNPQFLKYTGSWRGVRLALHSLYTDSGVSGLFRGHSATLLRVFPYASSKFVAYEQVRAFLIPTRKEETWVRRIAAGSAAGVTSVFLTYPLEVVRVRLAFETRETRRLRFREIIQRIYHEPHSGPPGVMGVSNFYRGFTATILGMLPYAGVSFLSHDLMHDLLRSATFRPWTIDASKSTVARTDRPPLVSWAQLLAGGMAGLMGQTASYPMEVIRRRLQVRGAMGERKFLGIGETAKMIVREHGWRGFWVGLTIGYVKVVPMTATSFLVYTRCKYYLNID